jgi:phage-related protein
MGDAHERLGRNLSSDLRHRVMVVRVFVKKTQKTPQREIDLALQRAKEVSP